MQFHAFKLLMPYSFLLFPVPRYPFLPSLLPALPWHGAAPKQL